MPVTITDPPRTIGEANARVEQALALVRELAGRHAVRCTAAESDSVGRAQLAHAEVLRDRARFLRIVATGYRTGGRRAAEAAVYALERAEADDQRLAHAAEGRADVWFARTRKLAAREARAARLTEGN